MYVCVCVSECVSETIFLVKICDKKNVTYFISLAFITIGTINLYFIYFADIDMWVNFKFFGVTFLILVTVSSTLFYLFSKTTSSSET